MRYLLDTNAVSALMRGDQRFLARLRRLRPGDVGLPQPVVAELAYGLERLPRSRRRDRLRHAFGAILGELAAVPWTFEVSAAFGQIKAALEARGARLEDFDVAIAAHAVAHGVVLVSGNLAHLSRVHGLELEDWAG